ncbi:unnamed protein product [Ceratitis capitata]|uniref:(Mediterranean fruit fly) hypothetical protein n=1 Tax=Ceratitis capitata TaxID=7213 RepID=A0A811V822_CERCA|nr:unnamed protein product [Ceratitis capitata]
MEVGAWVKRSGRIIDEQERGHTSLCNCPALIADLFSLEVLTSTKGYAQMRLVTYPTITMKKRWTLEGDFSARIFIFTFHSCYFAEILVKIFIITTCKLFKHKNTFS